MEKRTAALPHPGKVILWGVAGVGLYVASLYNYLLFHVLAEGFSIVVAFGVFMIAWSARRFLEKRLSPLRGDRLRLCGRRGWRAYPGLSGHGGHRGKRGQYCHAVVDRRAVPPEPVAARGAPVRPAPVGRGGRPGRLCRGGDPSAPCHLRLGRLPGLLCSGERADPVQEDQRIRHLGRSPGRDGVAAPAARALRSEGVDVAPVVDAAHHRLGIGLHLLCRRLWALELRRARLQDRGLLSHLRGPDRNGTVAPVCLVVPESETERGDPARQRTAVPRPGGDVARGGLRQPEPAP